VIKINMIPVRIESDEDLRISDPIGPPQT
jgi:hypothetical protein